MDRNQLNNSYIVFWKTRKADLSKARKISMLKILLGIVEQDNSIKLWGRYEEQDQNDKLNYTGFALIYSDDIDATLKKYEKYIKFTAKQQYTDVIASHKLLHKLDNL